jgi:hypothetical protein
MTCTVWSTPADIRERLTAKWLRGDLLRAERGEPLYPLTLPLRRPTTSELSERFDEVRTWIAALDAESADRCGFGYTIGWGEVRHRVLGTNRIPTRVVLPTASDALRLIGKEREAAAFTHAAETTLRAFPALQLWIARKPLVLVENAAAWDRILRVLRWFHDHPRPGRYLRQLDIPGVDTKFIETRKGLVAELLDITLDPQAVDKAHGGARGFEQRYGLLAKPTLVRFRVLDPRQRIGGFSDISVPLDEFAQAALDIDAVFVTENDANGLAFPDVARSIVLFGLGYGVESLGSIAWLAEKRIVYWGDIDTHGFAMLDRLRRHFPHTRSFLMDRTTLFDHRELWSREESQHRESPANLTADERQLYDDLRASRFGDAVRLEQERIAYHCVTRALVEELQHDEGNGG